MRRLFAPAAVLVAVLLLGGACGDEAPQVRMNEIQVLGSHNSYHLRPAPEVLAGIAALAGEQAAESSTTSTGRSPSSSTTSASDSSSSTSTPIPTGAVRRSSGRRARRPADRSGEPALDEPGFKVIHQVDIDFLTTCLTFVACLTEIEDWSSANPDHLPMMIMVEAKQDSLAEATGGAIDWGPSASRSPRC